MSEHDEQVNFVNWFRKTFKNVLIYSTPNGAHLQGKSQQERIKQWKHLESEGCVSGIPDLHVPKWDLWIEMKTEIGSLSIKQKKVIKTLREFDTVLVCYGYEDAKKQTLAFVKRMPPVIEFKRQKQIDLRTKCYET